MALLQISEPGQSPMPHQFKRAIGIDLGTTNSLVAMVGNAGKAQVIRDAEDRALLPSVVHYAQDAAPVVGYDAAHRAQSDPYNTLASFKRLMGRGAADVADSQQYVMVSAEGEAQQARFATRVGDITPIEASAEILRALALRARDYAGGEIDGAVVTVPAYFDDAQRQATKDAARLAGLKVLRLINEPTAAAVAYGLDSHQDGYVAVYDLGGGTFDISILQLSEGVFEVLASGGDAALGGDDFDRSIANWVLAQAGVQAADLSPSSYRTLLHDARIAKQQLSEQQHVELALQAEGIDWSGTLDRRSFEALIAGLVETTIARTLDCLKDAGLDVAHIDDVVLVGGSTRVPLVRQQVAALFGKPARDSVDPDQVVALGAAIQADTLVGNQRGEQLLLLDVTPLSLGIETMGGLVETLVHRNTPIPTARAQEFTTYQDGQTAMALHVVQGERDRVEDCRSLARFELRGIPPMVAGAARIVVTFALDADGVLEVSAEETTTGTQARITVKPSYGLEENEISRMLTESYTHAAADRDARMLAEQQVEARALVAAVEAALQADADLLDPAQREGIDQALALVRTCVEGDDRQVIANAIEQLGAQTESFAALRMDRSIKQALQGRRIDDVVDS